MPQSTEGVLLVIGALFFLIGLLGGGFEVSAIKIPPIEKYPRVVVFGMGIVLLLAGLFRILVPATPAITLPPNTIVALATAIPAATLTTLPPSSTPAPTSTPISFTPTPVPSTVTPTVDKSTPATPTLFSTANIQNVTVDYDVTAFGQTGMLIHVKFLADGMKNVKGRVMAYFYDSNGEELKSHDSKDLSADSLFKYQAADGQLIVWDYITPVFDSAQFNDFQLFMPYDAIELPSGKYDLKFRVAIYDLRDAAQSLAQAPDFPFSFSRK